MPPGTVDTADMTDRYDALVLIRTAALGMSRQCEWSPGSEVAEADEERPGGCCFGKQKLLRYRWRC